jgi:hypothetical protein
MKQSITLSKVLPTALAFAAVSATQAQWLEHTSVTTGVTTNSTFIGGSGAYSGNVSSSISNVIDGMSNGVPGILPGAQNLLTPTFFANYPANPSGHLRFLNVTGNDSGDMYKVTMDFTGLSLGYLPAGTLVSFLDVDISEQVERLVAFDTTATQFSTPWLTPSSISVFDYDMSDGTDGIAPSQAAAVSNTGGMYQLSGTQVNQTATFQGFNTNQNLTKMEWTMSRPIGQLVAGGYGYGVALKSQPVPEPASCAALVVGAMGLVARRRARRQSA